jgi:hypothetical protein
MGRRGTAAECNSAIPGSSLDGAQRNPGRVLLVSRQRRLLFVSTFSQAAEQVAPGIEGAVFDLAEPESALAVGAHVEIIVRPALCNEPHTMRKVAREPMGVLL